VGRCGLAASGWG